VFVVAKSKQNIWSPKECCQKLPEIVDRPITDNRYPITDIDEELSIRIKVALGEQPW
jgi:hypothetical protein